MLLFALSFFITDNNELAVKVAFLSGLMLDALGTNVFGQTTLAMTAIFICLMLFKRLLGKSLLFYSAFSILAIVLFDFMIHLPKLLDIKTLLSVVPINLISLVLIFPLVSWLNELFKKNTIRRI